MAKRKEKLIEKIVKKDYSDELETILEEKKFNVNECRKWLDANTRKS